MSPVDPVTVGELSRQLERMEGTIGREIRELKDTMGQYVPREVFDTRLGELRDDLQDLDDDLKAQALTRKQFVTAAAVIVIGEILALFIALSNLAARTGGLLP